MTPTPAQETQWPLSDEFSRALVQEFPGFRMIAKCNSGLSRVIDLALKGITLGGQKRFMTHYHTVIGRTLYLPLCWGRTADVDRLILLRHERVHLQQRERLGFFGMALLYLFPFLPLGLAYGRARLEWEAYEETLRAIAEHYGLERLRDAALKKEIVGRFTGPDYGWMWPFPQAVAGWFDRTVAALEAAAQSSEPGPLDSPRRALPPLSKDGR